MAERAVVQSRLPEAWTPSSFGGDGGCPGGLPPTSTTSGGTLVCAGRGEQATDRRNGAAPASRSRVKRSGSITSMSRNGTANLGHDLRTPLGLAACRSHPATGRPRTLRRCCGAWLVEDLHPDADKVVLVMDNLNTHNIGIACTRRSRPTQARRIAERLEIHHTPKHRQLAPTVAEIEPVSWARQCLDRRIGAAETLVCEVGAWEEARNEQAIGVHWRFTTADARIKLRRLYPSPL